jgi:hypothetical protein
LEELVSILEELDEKMPLLEQVTNPALKPRHWAEILDVMAVLPQFCPAEAERRRRCDAAAATGAAAASASQHLGLHVPPPTPLPPAFPCSTISATTFLVIMLQAWRYPALTVWIQNMPQLYRRLPCD